MWSISPRRMASFERARAACVTVPGILLGLFTLFNVNFPWLQQQSDLAIFVGLGMVLCFLVYPTHPRLKSVRSLWFVDTLLALAAVACCGYVVIQSEPAFDSLWTGGRSLGDRAGSESATCHLPCPYAATADI